jgi:hypothetical protein
MSRFVESELEDNVFASVTSQVQAEGIQTLGVKGIWCREDNIRIDGCLPKFNSKSLGTP